MIGRRAHHVSEADARDYVSSGSPASTTSPPASSSRRGAVPTPKGFDTFAPLGPCVTAGIDYHAMAGVGIEGWVNGERRQNSSTKQLVFSIDYPGRHITRVMTLLPGDVIATGTPSGIGPLKAGDKVTIRIPGVGDLINPVADETAAQEQGESHEDSLSTPATCPTSKPLVPLGIIDGVTTNPSLLAKEKGRPARDPEEDLRARAGPGQRRGGPRPTRRR
mgnify:CR=1 FL=1